MRIRNVLFFFSLVGFGLQAGYANIHVYPNVLNMAYTQSSADITVQNSGDQVAYVEATITKVENPGMPDQKSVNIPEGSSPFEAGIALTPTKMVIPPNGQQVVRLIPFVKATAKDLIYIVNIFPVSGALIDHEKVKEGAASASVSFTIGYGVRVILLPKTPVPVLQATRQGKVLEIINTGNTNALLGNGKQCIDKVCHPIDQSTRLYAGTSWKVTLPYDAPVVFQEDVIGNYSNFTVS